MSDYAGFPSVDFQVGRQGEVIEPAERQRAIERFGGGAVTDLLVISHGWNNHIGEAHALYAAFLGALRTRIDAGPAAFAGRRLGVLAVLWPSKKFADAALIPGQAAAIDDQAMLDALRDQIDTLAGGFDAADADARLAAARALLPALAGDPQARKDFVALVRGLLGKAPGAEEGSTSDFETLDAQTVMEVLQGPVVLPAAPADDGGAASLGMPGGIADAGGAARIGSFFSGFASAANNLLNLTTYYQMKERAGLLGRGTVHALVRDILATRPGLRVHLAGHSFGARLVASVALGPEGSPALPFGSMTLLQAAFSHHAFSDGTTGHPVGFFRAMLEPPKRLNGPVLITHTRKDLPVGLAYPLASRLAGQNAAGFGAANDPYGGLGRNGAQGTPEAVAQDFGNVGASYRFAPGAVYNMNGERLIRSHSDIVHPEIADALLQAMVATP